MTNIKGMLLAVSTALLVTTVAHAQFIATEKEVRRQDRLQWLEKKRHIPIYHDERVQAYARCIANRLIAVLPPEFAEIEWEVIVFDDDLINAGADSNGKIDVYTGLLQVADTQDALAAVIGHEIAHVTQGHTMERARKSARQEIWSTLGGAAIGSPETVRTGLFIGLALPFVREHETEADLVGLDYMSRAGFDPRAAVYLWKGMSEAHAAQEGKLRQAEFLRTHPTDSQRLNDIASQLGPALAKYNAAREAGKRPNCTIAAPTPRTQ
jgi:predicted Zn-dependent protease